MIDADGSSSNDFTSNKTNQQARNLESIEEANVTKIGEKWAVIIGISKYQDSSINLEYADRDAQDFYDILTQEKEGFFKKDNIIKLINEQATAQKIRSALGKFLKKPDKDDLFLLYFACHGHNDPDIPDNCYILPYDTDRNEIESTTLPMDDITTWIRKFLKARKKIIIADACHSGNFGGDIGRRSLQSSESSEIVTRYLKDLANSIEGTALLTSAEAREVAREGKQWGDGHGVFTHYLIEGIKGEADGHGGREKDGIISIGELFEYVREKVKEATDNMQHPVIGSSPFDRKLPLIYLESVKQEYISYAVEKTPSIQIRKLSFAGEKRLFIGRKDYLETKIKNEIKEPGSRVSIVGPGGSGKSQLAFKALHQYYEKDKIIDLVITVYLSPYSSAHESDGRTTTIVTTNITFRKFLNEIGFNLIKNKILRLTEQQFEDLDVDDCKTTIYNILSEIKHPFLYCDNFETISSLEKEKNNNVEIRNILNFLNDELPPNTSMLLTSRIRRNFVAGEKVLDLEGLDIEKGIELFIEYASTYRKNLENKQNKALQDLLEKIVTRTGGHPLSIEILAKTYEGNGTIELQTILDTLGKERQDPLAKEQRLLSLHESLKFSIDKLDSNIQEILPMFTIFHSPFPAEAVKQIFEIQEEQADVPSDLYNKSLLMRIEEDRCGELDDRFWLYTIHPATRNYLEYAYSDKISKSLNYQNFVSNYCKYYQSLIQRTNRAWGTDNHTNFIRRFDLMSLSEGKNDFDMAIEYAENFRSDDKQQEEDVNWNGSSLASYLGLIYENLGQYNKSLHNHNKSLEINKKLNHQGRMAIDYINIGTVYYWKGQYDDALAYHKKALEIQEELNDRIGVAGSYSNMGVVYNDKGQYDDSLAYHKKALEIQEELNFKVGMAAGYSNIGLVYRNKGQYDDALSYHKRSLEIDEELNDRVAMAVDYSNIGNVYFKKGQYDDALSYHKRSLEIREGLNDKVNVLRNFTSIGDVYLTKKDKLKAKGMADNALKVADEFQNATGTEHPHKSLIDDLLKSINESSN